MTARPRSLEGTYSATDAWSTSRRNTSSVCSVTKLRSGWRIENIFTPSELDLPDWLTRIMPPPVEAPQTDSPFDRNPSSPYDPFTAFLEQLFDEQDAQDWPDDGASEES